MIGILQTDNQASQEDGDYAYEEMQCHFISGLHDVHYVISQDAQNIIHHQLMDKTENFRFLPLKFIPKKLGDPREYKVGMGFFNFIFSADDLGY